ncbi:MAG: IS630 family transposase [bacterium]
MWCVPKVNKQFKERMEDVLNLYQKPYNPIEPVICVDEKSKQLLQDARKPLRAKAGKLKRADYEYRRNGTRNIFLSVEPKAGQRQLKVTRYRKKPDFAQFIKELSENHYANAEKIHIVLDNLNTHFEKSFYETFPEMEASCILKRIKFHYTPKHASWLNMAEIELSIAGRQCLNRRIPAEEKLKQEIGYWQNCRNDEKLTIQWKFTVKDARKKFKYNHSRQN